MSIKKKIINGKLKCALCLEFSLLENFPKDKYSSTGYYSYCKACAKDRTSKEYRKRKNSPEYLAGRMKSSIKSRFGISIEEYLNKKAASKICEICKNPFKSSFDKQLDHCHGTGKLRGILCAKCNKALGLINDDINLLKAAITYLESYK